MSSEGDRPRAGHVAIVAGGCEAWAERRGLDVAAGWRAGARALERTVAAAQAEGIATLTVQAVSSTAWSSRSGELEPLLDLIADVIERLRRDGDVRLDVVGRRDRLPADFVSLLERASGGSRVTDDEASRGASLHLRLGVDYSSRHAIAETARRLARTAAGRRITPELFEQELARTIHSASPASDVDLLVRAGGGRKLGDVLLWECAYAELVFTEQPWPEFGPDDLHHALQDFRSRERRFGGLVQAAR